MSFLLDTNVVSEWVRPRPDEHVVAWLEAVDEEEVFMSVVSFAELRRGVDLLPPGRRRDRLDEWIEEDLATRFHGRIIEVDRPIADAWGRMMVRVQRAGRALGAMDAFFAATAESHELTLVTRNTRDFTGLHVALHNPWEPG